MATTEATSLPKLEDLKVDAEPSVTITSVPSTSPSSLSVKIESLKPQLSSGATIYFPSDIEFVPNTDRWSTFNAPNPGAVVNVTTEADIAATVKWANSTQTPFLARSGGHGFTSTISSLGPNGVIINLRALNTVTVSLESHTATISAGALTQEVIEVAHAAKAHVVTGVCNSVGAISPMLGGGLGNLVALYGMAVDNMLSARLVTATGNIITVSAEENADLWWGLRGAGHNFGIVSQLTVKAHEQVNGGVHWAGTIAFPGTEENVVRVVEGLNALGLGDGKPMGCTMVWAKVPPEFQPTILVNVWYAGTPEAANAAFSPLLSLDSVMNMTGPVPYTQINAASDFACVKNGNKRPCYGSAISSPIPATMVTLFKDWIAFTSSDPGLGAAVLLTECYDFKKARDLGGEGGMETAFPWREKNTFLFASPNFADDKLDRVVVEYGRRVRDTIGEKDVYMNFASGDEELEDMYGNKERVERLKALKKKWDPTGVFNGYNPIV